MKKNILLLAASIFLLIGLKAQTKISKTDLADLYADSDFTSINALAYHTFDSLSIVHINVFLEDLQYNRNPRNDKRRAKFRISYQLYESFLSKYPIDSASQIYYDSLNYNTAAEMILNFDIKASYPNTYVLHIKLEDLYRKESNVIHKYMKINKSNRFTRQNFFITDSEDFPIFNQSIKKEQYFKVQYNNEDQKELTIRYYNKAFPLAKPPFSAEKEITYTFEPDSFYTITLSNGRSDLLELQHHGLYHFQADIRQKEGFTLFHFDDGFPNINTPEQAIIPLRYLTTQKEYDKLLSYKNYKTAVDSFWLKRSSQQEERARNMIAKYYSRVEKANDLFTSYQEGWKTDRGMIFIIYGPPTEVYRNDKEEKWVYGNSSNPMSINFFFLVVENPFTDNAYSLNKSPLYKDSWYIAIENWRR